jgi:hypothetical protein
LTRGEVTAFCPAVSCPPGEKCVARNDDKTESVHTSLGITPLTGTPVRERERESERERERHGGARERGMSKRKWRIQGKEMKRAREKGTKKE